MVFATEVNSFFLIWGFMILPLLLSGYIMIGKLFGGFPLPKDAGLGLISYGVTIAFVIIGVKRFYRMATWKAVLIAILFFFAHYLIVQIIYKFLLFVISAALL